MMMMPLQSAAQTAWYASSKIGGKAVASQPRETLSTVTPLALEAPQSLPAVSPPAQLNTDVFTPQQQPVQEATTPSPYTTETNASQTPTDVFSVASPEVATPPITAAYPYPEYNAPPPTYGEAVPTETVALPTYPTSPTTEPSGYGGGYPSYYPAYPSSPTAVVPQPKASPPKYPQQQAGLVWKVALGLLGTLVTGVTTMAIFENRDRLFQAFPTNVVSHTKAFFQQLWAGIDGKPTATTALQEALTTPVIHTKEGAFALLHNLKTYSHQTALLGHEEEATKLKALEKQVEELIKEKIGRSAQYPELAGIKEQLNDVLAPITHALTRYPEELALLAKAEKWVALPHPSLPSDSTLLEDVKYCSEELKLALKRAFKEKEKAKKVEELSEKLKKGVVSIEAARLYEYTRRFLEKADEKNLKNSKDLLASLETLYQPLLEKQKFEQLYTGLLASEHVEKLKEHFVAQAHVLVGEGGKQGVLAHLANDTHLPADVQLAIGLLNETVKRQVSLGATAQSLAFNGMVDARFAELLEKHPELKTKVEKQLGLMESSSTGEIDSTYELAFKFLDQFTKYQSATKPPARKILLDKKVFNDEEKKLFEEWEGKDTYPTLIPLIQPFFDKLYARPEDHQAWMKTFRKKTQAVDAGIERFNRAYKGNKKISNADRAKLKNTLVAELWEKPDDTQHAYQKALKQAGWWERNRPSWSPI